jgi:pimeloyl-ACP methyl ester carboxylesterase
MATFVLVHGGHHGGWCYKKVARMLQARGHIVYFPSMSGMGERAHLMHPGINLDTHITDIVRILEVDDLNDAILVGHSYGGMIITGVADRATDRVGHRVYLDAAYPTNGQSLLVHANANIGPLEATKRVVDGVELVGFPEHMPPQFFGITDPEDVAFTAARLGPQPWATYTQPLVLTNEAAMRAIPESHLICTSTIPGRNMDLLRERSQGRVWDIDTGHDLMITEPDWVVDRLEAVAASMG